MSGLVDLAIETIRREGIRRVPEGVERAAEKALDAADEWLEEKGPDLPPIVAEFASIARKGVEGLRPAVPFLANRAHAEVSAIFERIAGDDWDAADALAAAQQLTPMQRIEAQERGDHEALVQGLTQDQAWERFKEIAQGVAQDALKAAVPVILAALA